MNKIILIDNDYDKGWEEVFSTLIDSIYKKLITFEALHEINNEAIEKCYLDNPGALIIQDNQLGKSINNGIFWVEKFHSTNGIIMHSADGSDVAFKVAKLGGLFFMKKDDPSAPMNNEQMREMIIEFNKTIISYFKLAPELLWIVINKMK